MDSMMKCCFRYSMWYPLWIMSLVSRWFHFYLTYFQFCFRKFRTAYPEIVDSRFCDYSQVCFFPMKCCSDVVCYSKNKPVNLTYSAFNNLRNVGAYADSALYLETIKKFCMLPSNIDKIHCVYFPWENKSQSEFYISNDTVFVPKDVI